MDNHAAVPILPPELVYDILDRVITCTDWALAPDSDVGPKWYLSLRLLNRYFNSIVFANFVATVLGPKEMVNWYRGRRSLPPTDGGVEMGRSILRAVMRYPGSNRNTESGGTTGGGLDSPRERSHYSLVSIIVEAVDEMVSFFAKSRAAASIDKHENSSTNAVVATSTDETDETRRVIYLGAAISVIGVLGADWVIELLADRGKFQRDERNRNPAAAAAVLWPRVALMVTAYLGRVSEMKTLLELPGADATCTYTREDEWLLPPLMSAGLGGYFNTVKLLVKQGVSLESRMGESGENILHFAALGGHVKLVRFLLKEVDGAAEAENIVDHTPLIWALASGRTAVAKELLDPYHKEKKKGKKTKKQKEKHNVSLSTPDELTEQTATDQAELFRYALLSQKIDPILEAFPGILEQRSSFLSVAEWGTAEQLRSVLAVQKPPINYQNDAGATALHLAINCDKYENARILLEQPGLDINLARKYDGDTPLHVACGMSLDIAKLVLARHDVDLLALDSVGRTPFMTAAHSCRPEICDFLLQRLGTNIWHKDLNGDTALSLAVYSEDQKIVRHLLDSAPGISKEIIRDSIHSVDEYLAGPKRLPKKWEYLIPIRERQHRIRKGTYRILTEYLAQMDGQN
ncbi:ankyrin repeat-containing domain protein [Aspergillus pseudoustus]|uniref:Ankyrin repeat-containing domain protein n=1 Tax=Aspergillus pseudoustus TaxID=1810923 RepID=A0ABR4J6E4_9EURO